MEDLENENYINSLLIKTEYYNEHKQLEEMGFDKLMIKKIYAYYINAKTFEERYQLMLNINDIYQHEFFSINNDKCFYCRKEPKFHINYINNKKEQNNKLQLEGLIFENELGDNIIISEHISKHLTEKGKKATCKIISMDENGKTIYGSGFFCKIKYFYKIIKVLLTNNHILNYDTIKKGNKIKFVYQGSNKIIEINDIRFCKTSPTYDFTCIEILDEDKIEDFYEIEKINKDYNYDNELIAIPQYPEGGIMIIKVGHLIKIINENIRHKVCSGKGSSGSPIILLSNFKVIGIHKAYDDYIDLNLGLINEHIIENINKNEILFEINIER